jgi:hypothetical protein
VRKGVVQVTVKDILAIVPVEKRKEVETAIARMKQTSYDDGYDAGWAESEGLEDGDFYLFDPAVGFFDNGEMDEDPF